MQADLTDEVVAARATCASQATPQSLGDGLSGLVADVVAATTASPALLPGGGPGWIAVTPEEEVHYQGRELRPICLHGAPYQFFARRGTVNKLVVYYQGGGSCWNYLTCSVPTADPTVQTSDLTNHVHSGLGDLRNPANPFRDWSWVFVPYCSGDVHFGDAQAVYTQPGREPLPIEHRGFVNAQVVEKWARDHFVLPEQVFVAGSSAGGFGAVANGAYLMEFAWPSSHFDVLSDANNGVVTRDFLENDLANWGLVQNTPNWIPGLDQILSTEYPAASARAETARYYPWNRFATYTTAYDGGAGAAGEPIPSQTAGYNIQLNDGNPFAALTWWEASCAWNEAMQDLNQFTYARAPDNYRSYVGAGSQHMIWMFDKVYDDTAGGVPPVADWVNAMLAGTEDWQNVQCQDCGVTLSGDPKPSVLPTPPFDEYGNIVCDVPELAPVSRALAALGALAALCRAQRRRSSTTRCASIRVAQGSAPAAALDGPLPPDTRRD